jgi:hypothetical protein
MALDTFNPNKFIDREFEQELFEELLQLKDNARILTIRDRSGTGKSSLLHQYAYRCRLVRPRIPVSLVGLGQLHGDSPLALVQQIERNLSISSLEFPTFTHYTAARLLSDFELISKPFDFREGSLNPAEISAALMIEKIEVASRVRISGAPTFTPEQDAIAQKICVDAFLSDLVNHCRRQLVVLMLDAYERCPSDLQQWLLESLLEPYCFDQQQRPDKLVIVIAGQEIPDFESRWSPDDCATIVKSVHGLSKWTAAHVEEYFRVYGYSYEPDDIDVLLHLIERGIQPAQVVQLIEMIGVNRQRHP